jgi:hypothetical protein
LLLPGCSLAGMHAHDDEGRPPVWGCTSSDEQA